MLHFIAGLWRSLTATGRLLVLGAGEAWGFWLATIPLLLTVLFAASMLNGLAWRMIEGRLRPKLRDRDAEAALRAEIARLQAALFVAGEERHRLEVTVAEQRRVIDVRRSFHRNWNADAARVTARAGR